MGAELEARISLTLDRLERKIDALGNELTAHRVEYAGRLAKVETKSGITASVLGAITGFLAGMVQ